MSQVPSLGNASCNLYVRQQLRSGVLLRVQRLRGLRSCGFHADFSSQLLYNLKTQDCRLGLVLGGRGHLALDREVR
jgi:hypothetical protein